MGPEHSYLSQTDFNLTLSHLRSSLPAEAVWNRRSLKADHKFVTGSVYPLRTSRLSGSISDLPSYGSGLERLCYRYMR